METAREIQVRAADGTRLRTLWWPGAQAPAVLLLPGRSEPVEKYREVVAELRARALPVRALDWRGQGLSERLPGLGERGHVDSFDVLADDLATVLAEMDGPTLVLGHSMGAAVALRLMQTRPEVAGRLTGMVLTAPMTGLPTWGHPPWLVRALARLHRLAGRGRAYVRGGGDWAIENHAFEGNRRTHSRLRFEREVALLRAHPELRVGGPTWGWLDAAFHLTDALRGPWPEASLALPLAVAVGAADPYVSATAQRAFFARFPQARVDIIPDALHEILMETDPARARFWRLFDQALPPVTAIGRHL